MIVDLRITGLGVIDSAEIELGPGLNVVTGETGAGKTMVLSALGLLLGGRADPSRVRPGTAKAVVEGAWVSTPVLARQVEEVGGDLDEDRVLLARTVSAEGRSRAYLGGRGVPASVLAGLAEELVVVHGQSDQQRLARPERQRQLLDAFAGASVAEVLQRYRGTYDDLRQRVEELERITTSTRERAQRAEFLRFALAEIERVDPQPGEETSLAEEEERLGHAEQLREAAAAAHQHVSGSDVEPTTDAQSEIALAVAELRRAGVHDQVLASLAERLTAVLDGLADVGTELSSYVMDLAADPARLAHVSQRRAELTNLLGKYGESTQAVLDWAGRAALELADVEDDGRQDRLKAEVAALRARLAEDAQELSRQRAMAASKLSAAITAELAGLAMPKAQVVVQSTARLGRPESRSPGSRLVVAVGDEHWECGPFGADEVVFGLRPYPAADVMPISSAASGGELSRVMLAVEVTLAGDDPPPTLVFDEVDAGIGGAAAVAVGRRLASLAERAQVVVVTHLPQVAAFGSRHFRVSRGGDGETTQLRQLPDRERVTELARMLAGRDGSDAALKHAEELLAEAAPPH